MSLKLGWNMDSLFKVTDFSVSEQQRVLSRYESYSKNPKEAHFAFVSGLLVLLILSIGVVFYIGWAFLILFLFACGFLFFLTDFFYIRDIRNLQRDVLKLEYALNKGWYYDPSSDPRAFTVLRSNLPYVVFPGFFPYVESSKEHRNIQDRMYGSINGSRFWSGIIERTSFLSKFTQVVVVEIPFRVQHDLWIEAGSRRKRSSLQTESTLFNTYFRIVSRKKKDEEDMISKINTLSPSVIDRLNLLRNSFPCFKCLIHKQYAVFILPNRIFRKMHTNFFKSPIIDSRDLGDLDKKLHDFVSMGVDLARVVR